MLIQLPVKTWIEILDWLRRRDLIKKLDSLWDREFTPIVQDWLHKYTRNVKLRRLWANSDGLSVSFCRNSGNVPFAEVELPGNVTNFERISIRYLDSALLAFLCRMSPLFHRNNNIKLVVYQVSPNPTTLRHLMPLFGSIESLSLGSTFLQFFSTNYPATLFNAKLLENWIHKDQVPSDESEQILVDWLFTKRTDGHARTLILRHYGFSGFYEKIRQRFLDPARQCANPFFVRFWNAEGLSPNILVTVNERTGEQLTLKTVEQENYAWSWNDKLITNCPLNTSLEWLNKKAEKVLKWDMRNEQQVIMLESLLKISPELCAAEDEDANQQQQASGSGMKKLN